MLLPSARPSELTLGSLFHLLTQHGADVCSTAGSEVGPPNPEINATVLDDSWLCSLAEVKIARAKGAETRIPKPALGSV